MKNKKYQFEIEENNVIRAAIAPMGIDFRPNTRFYMGDYICRLCDNAISAYAGIRLGIKDK